jgi:hypothetical protein
MLLCIYASKANAQIFGTGTVNTIPKVTGVTPLDTIIGNSQLIDDGTTVGIGGGTIPYLGPLYPKLYVYGAGGYFDIPNLPMYQGTNRARIHINRASSSYETMLAFDEAGVSNWLFGLWPDATQNLYVYHKDAGPLMTFAPSGSVGVHTTNPITAFHINGDFTFGHEINKRKWRFITQTWIDHGRMFLLPDDNAGNPDYTKALTMDPVGNIFTFGYFGGMNNVAIGNTTGLTITNTYVNSSGTFTHNYDGNVHISFNANHSPNLGWQTHGDGQHNGGTVLWENSAGELIFSIIPTTGGGDNFVNAAFVNNHKALRVRWNTAIDQPQVVVGNQTITAGNHADFRLSVDGKMVTKEIYVTIQNWADYVFSDEYKLKSLSEVEQYIKANSHLPNVPSAKEITENGNNMAETDRILLEKVEELTLYIIQLNKRIEELEKQSAN